MSYFRQNGLYKQEEQTIDSRNNNNISSSSSSSSKAHTIILWRSGLVRVLFDLMNLYRD